MAELKIKSVENDPLTYLPPLTASSTSKKSTQNFKPKLGIKPVTHADKVPLIIIHDKFK